MKLPIGTDGDPRFSQRLPGMQLQVNSSSLGPFKQCPRKYYYTIVTGLETAERSIHLTFGTLVHKASEIYDLNKLEGLSHEENLLATLKWALRATWDFRLGRPWQSGHSDKNRTTFIRSIIWYLEQYGANDNLETVVLANGSPAVELDFEFESGYLTGQGESVTFIGKLDKLVRLGDDPFVKDIKTTGYALDPGYWKRYNPDNQFSLYTVAGKVAFGIGVKGIICDAVQVGVTFSRFARNLIPRTDDQLNEWLADAMYWLRQMETCAIAEYWPQNDKSCGLYGGCEFRDICAMSPGARPRWLESGFKPKDRTKNEDLI